MGTVKVAVRIKGQYIDCSSRSINKDNGIYIYEAGANPFSASSSWYNLITKFPKEFII